MTSKIFAVLAVSIGVATLAAVVPGASAQRRGGGRGGPPAGVYKASVTPHWFADDTKFWYRNDLRGSAKEFILVDAGAGNRQPAFDHAKLAAALSKASGETLTADKLPFQAIEFSADGKSVMFKAGDTGWKCDLDSYVCAKADVSAALDLPEAGPPGFEVAEAETGEGPSMGHGYPSPNDLLPNTSIVKKNQGEEDDTLVDVAEATKSADSPDGKWTAFIKDQNVCVKPKAGGAEVQLSKDGVSGNFYGLLEWSPDSKTLAAWRIEPGPLKMVSLIQSSPPGGGRAVLRTRPYWWAGDQFTAYEINLFEVEAGKQIKPQVDRLDFGVPKIRWKQDGKLLTYEKDDRGHQRYRLIEVNTQSGAVRNIIDEKTSTFIWSVSTPGADLPAGIGLTYLDETDEIIYLTERDGWKHLYLVNEKTGDSDMKLITKGDWIVRAIDKIDAQKREIWFRASGIYPDQDPYFIHYCRVKFDGTGLVIMTAGDGTHTIAYSPDNKYLIDNYSRVDMAPVTELRRASDGKLVCDLEKADISELQSRGFQFPEVIKAKGRDGKTDIWGFICRPAVIDPAKKYPVVEDIYAGPHSSFVPKGFGDMSRYAPYTTAGLIVAKVDGMGTANRSKAFHDVCWHNIKDAGFPDRILWHEAINKKYPYYDITRVGLYGTSAGGQDTVAGLLFHPEFYKVGVANCGCHDNRMDKAWWNEQWMGYMAPDKIWSTNEDNWYSQSSNIDNAWRLKGKLLLIGAELDTNVPPESTLRLVDALIKAGRDFDFFYVPGANHGAASSETARRTQEYLIKHLLGVEPPDHNAASAAAPASGR